MSGFRVRESGVPRPEECDCREKRHVRRGDERAASAVDAVSVSPTLPNAPSPRARGNDRLTMTSATSAVCSLIGLRVSRHSVSPPNAPTFCCGLTQ